MAITLFNTASHKKEEFTPLVEGKASVYACGPTVYNYAHLGNLRAYIFMDILHRVLSYNGLDVNLVMNITDVGHLTDDADSGEDKMEKGAKREGKTAWDIAKEYTDIFMDDVHALNILDAKSFPKATDHIKEQTDLIEKIEANGFTYETKDGIYFDTSKLGNYGTWLIKNFNADELASGHRIEMRDKKNATDFALWKFSPEGEQRAMEWDFKGRKGFPGWHLECTAMAVKYLGNPFDIHTGGIDHIPIHHTNEIAQAIGAWGKPHVGHWMHNEFLISGKEKMAKSSGDFLRLQSVLDNGFEPLDYRYFCLLTHYRKSLQFSWEGVAAAAKARSRLNDKIIELKESVGPSSEMSQERIVFQERFTKSVNDDLNTPEALGILHEVLKSGLSDEEKLSLALDWDQVFGLALKSVHKEQFVIPDDVQVLVDQREAARNAKDWEKADELRNQIADAGFAVKDTDDGSVLSPR